MLSVMAFEQLLKEWDFMVQTLLHPREPPGSSIFPRAFCARADPETCAWSNYLLGEKKLQLQRLKY